MARTPEQRSFDTFKLASAGKLKVHRIENLAASSTPDMIVINHQGAVFWIENKALNDWPKRETTVPLKGKFEKGQLGFLREWQSWKGKAFVLLRVDKTYYLLNPVFPLETLPKKTFLEAACVVHGSASDIIKHLEGIAR